MVFLYVTCQTVRVGYIDAQRLVEKGYNRLKESLEQSVVLQQIYHFYVIAYIVHNHVVWGLCGIWYDWSVDQLILNGIKLMDLELAQSDLDKVCLEEECY